MFADQDDEKADEELRRILREKIASASAGDESDDAGGFDTPLVSAPANATVSAEDGFALADRARFESRPGADKVSDDFQKVIDDGTGEDKKDGAPAGTEGAAAATADATSKAATSTAGSATADAEKPEATPEAAQQQSDDLTTKPLADLLGAVDEKVRGEVARRVARADEFDALFKGREEQLKLHGDIKPAQAMSRLLELNDYAQRNPQEYLAWVATQMNPDQAHTVIEGAAKLLGYKIVPDMEQGDEFEDEKVKALREENHRLKLAQTPIHGPDAPELVTQRTVTQTIEGFATATDADGKLIRPFFETLKPAIAAMATQHRAQTGRAVTAEDLDRFYRSAEEEVRKTFGVQSSSAAHPPAPVQGHEPKTAAADVQRAKDASKSIDGTGQGADHRPALSQDASLKDTFRHFMKG